MDLGNIALRTWSNWPLAVLFGLLSASTANAQIDVTNSNGLTIEYNTNGTVANPGVLGVEGPSYGITVSGTDVFVTSSSAGTVGEYTTSGAVVNSSLITGLNDPSAIIVSGSNLYVANYDSNSDFLLGNGRVSQYTLGATNGTISASDANFITGVTRPDGLASSGSDLFVSEGYYLGSGNTIGEFTTTGTVVPTSLFSSNLDNPLAIAISGSDLYVANLGTTSSEDTTAIGTIGEFNISGSGSVVNPTLISGVVNPAGLAVSGSDIFVSNFGYVSGGSTVQTDGVGEYTISGTTVNPGLITTNYGIPSLGVVVLSQTSPPPPVTPTSTGSITVSSTSGYSAVTPLTSTGGYGTTASLVGGTNKTGSSQTVTLSSTNAGGSFTSLASDVVSVSGIDGSVFALQLTFDLNAANQLGGASAMTLQYQPSGSGTWELANVGDHGTNTTNPDFLDYQGSFASFVAQYGAEYSFSATDLSNVLGAYGVDTTTDTVWAVIDHNSNFSVSDVQSTPEPSTWTMLLGGLGLLAFWRTRRARV